MKQLFPKEDPLIPEPLKHDGPAIKPDDLDDAPDDDDEDWEEDLEDDWEEDEEEEEDEVLPD